MASNKCLWVIGSTIASLSSSICLSSPPISVYSSYGFSSSSIAYTLESYSAGNFSNNMWLSLLTPTKSPGFNSSGSSNPELGSEIVFLVEVLITTPLPLTYKVKYK